MIKIETLVFNPFQENTYLVYDDSRECVIIDAGCYSEHEQNHLKDYISEKGLKPVRLLNTHCHVDHILGNRFIFEEFALKAECHKEEQFHLDGAPQHGMMFGLQIEALPEVGGYLHEEDVIGFGNTQLQVLHLPGHSKGSLAFYDPEKTFAIVGDVLFRAGIGRTDLPGGDFQTLISSIKDKLFKLGDDVVIYPGHGPATNNGMERRDNPFLT